MKTTPSSRYTVLLMKTIDVLIRQILHILQKPQEDELIAKTSHRNCGRGNRRIKTSEGKSVGVSKIDW